MVSQRIPGYHSDEWLKDAYETMVLRIDRTVISTREMVERAIAVEGVT